MSRIVGFVGATAGAGATTICFELAKAVSQNNFRVLVIDFFFSINDLSQRFEKENKFDFKDYLVGRVGIDGICEQMSENLDLIKTNNARFDYYKYKDEIVSSVEFFSKSYDYIFIDINSFDLKNLKMATTVLTEAIIVFDNEINSIKNANRYLMFLRQAKNIANINLVFNKSKIIGQIKQKYLPKEGIEKALFKDILFEFPKFLYHNKKQQKNHSGFGGKILNKFCNSFITNEPKKINYKKSYKGIIGRVKRKIYERFE